MLKTTWEKVFEYASMPVHGTLSRKLRKDVKIQINDGEVYEGATIFLGEEFIRIMLKQGDEAINTYYDWDKLFSVRTYSKAD